MHTYLLSGKLAVLFHALLTHLCSLCGHLRKVALRVRHICDSSLTCSVCIMHAHEYMAIAMHSYEDLTEHADGAKM